MNFGCIEVWMYIKLMIYAFSVAQGIHDFKKGLQTEAMQSFNKALQIDKSNVEAFVARGAL